MKIVVTYDVIDQTGEQGETCMKIEIDASLRKYIFLNSRVHNALENLLENAEFLKSRQYIRESVKDIRLAPETEN